MKPYLIMSVFVFAFAFQPLHSQIDARGVALGGFSSSSSTGVSSIFVNPANLFLQNSSMSIALSPVSVSAGNNALNIREFTTTLQASKNLSLEERTNFAEKLSGSVVSFNVTQSTIATVFSISSKSAVGVATFSHAEGSVQIPSSLSALINGKLGFETIEISSNQANALVYNGYNLSYSYLYFNNYNSDNSVSPNKLQIGASFKYLQGISFAEVDNSSTISVTPFHPTGWDSTTSLAVNAKVTSFQSNRSGMNVNPSILVQNSNPAGIGLGLDFGATYMMGGSEAKPDWILSASITDLGSISWNNVRRNDFILHDTVHAINQIDEQYSNRVQQTEQTTSHDTWLATRLHLGATHNLSFNEESALSFVGELTQGFNQRGSNSLVPRISLGAEYSYASYLPSLRTGVSIGGNQALQWSGGFGYSLLDTVIIDAALGTLTNLVMPSASTQITAAFSLRVDL